MAKLKDRVPAMELDFIQRLFTFVNLDWSQVKSQYDAFRVFEGHPYVVLTPVQMPDGTTEPHISPMPEEEGIGWLEDHAYEMEGNLRLLGSKHKDDVSKVLDQVPQMLREKVMFQVDYDLKPGDLKVIARPMLVGMEAILWYAVALIAHHNLMKFLKSCKLDLDKKTGKPLDQRDKDKGKPCGKFFLRGTEQRDSRGRRVELRSYCSPRHAELGKPQAVLTAIKNIQNKKAEGLKRK